MAKRRPNNDGTIGKRLRNGKEEYYAALSYQDSNGKTKRKWLYGKTQKEVQQKLTKARADLQKGILVVADERQTVEQYLTYWLEHEAKTSVRPRTYIRYEQYVRRDMIPFIGHLPLTKLTRQHVQNLLKTRTEAGLSARTVSHIRSVLRNALNDAIKNDLLARNPAALAEPPKVPRHNANFLTPEQARELIQACQSDQYGTLHIVTLTLGLRSAEALGLRWSDVDLDNKSLRVEVTLQRFRGAFHLVEPKSETSRRVFTLPEPLVTLLKKHQERQQFEHEANRLMEGEKEGYKWGLVFTTDTGRPIHNAQLLQSFQRLLHRVGLPKMRFHDLRHSCASLLIAQGISPRMVMEQLGHSSFNITMNLYSHILPSMRQETADAMEQLFVEKSPQDNEN